MKYYLPLILILMILTPIKAQEEKNEITTYYLIRHAEKDRADNSNKKFLLILFIQQITIEPYKLLNQQQTVKI